MTTNLTLFDRLVAETQKFSPTPIGPISKGQLKRWNDLAAHWKANYTAFPNLFHEVIFHIARGRYSRASTTVKPLLRLIEEALLNDPDALRTWRTNPSFKISFMTVINEINNSKRWQSPAMCNFVKARLRVLLLYRDRTSPQLTYAMTQKRSDYRYACYQMEAQATYTHFIELIHLLVPDSQSWKPSQWLNEKLIFSQIYAIHGIDFSQHINDFTALVSLYRNKAERIPYYKNLFLITNLSTSIARAIWPVDMEEELVKQFNIACRVRPSLYQGQFSSYDPINPFNMVNSWVFRQLNEWRSNGNLVNKTVRSNFMQIALGNHPWVVKARQNGTI